MSDQPARTIIEVSAPLEHYLVPVPRRNSSVCGVCHGVVSGGYSACYKCNEASRVLGSLRLDAVSFLSLAPTGGQMARDLYTYKRDSVPQNLRLSRTVGLSAALWRWLARHEACLAMAAGCAGFDIVTTVPSTSVLRPDHPLTAIAGKIVQGTERRVYDTLALYRSDLRQHEHAADRFVAKIDVAGLNVLVIDDTWTVGANIHSASAALKRAGASRVGGVTLGRWINSTRPENAAWLRDIGKTRWTWDICCLE